MQHVICIKVSFKNVEGENPQRFPRLHFQCYSHGLMSNVLHVSNVDPRKTSFRAVLMGDPNK